MLRDAADETEDMKIVEQFDISAIDTELLNRDILALFKRRRN